MKTIIGLAVLAAAVLAFSCGKKSNSNASSDTEEVPVASLSLTCGGYTCIGTEGK